MGLVNFIYLGYSFFVNANLNYLKPNIAYTITAVLAIISAFGNCNASISSNPVINDKNKIVNISTTNGLPSNVITAIVKDKDGFMWIATPKGLCRWDGFSALVYQNDESDSSSLIQNRILRNELVYDSLNNQLVIGTSKGLSLLNLESYKFTNYYIHPEEENALSSPVNAVYIDKQHNLWIACDQGFSKFRPEKNDFVNYNYVQDLPPGIMLDKYSSNKIMDIKQDYYNDSILWMATLAGLLKFNKYSTKFKWFYFPETEYLREINLFTMLVPHADGNLYIGTWNFDMAIFNTLSETFTDRIGPAASFENQLPNRIVPYSQKSASELWVTSLQGFGVLNTRTKEIHFIESFKNESGHRFETELFYTDDKNYWLGSEHGVYVLNTEGKPVNNYFFEPLNEEYWYLTSDIFEDTISDKLIIAYGRGDGIHFFDLKDKQFNSKEYTLRTIKEYNLMTVLPNQSNEFYLLSLDDIHSYNRKSNKILQLNCSYSSFPAFTDMQKDTIGNIWVSSNNLGLQKYDAKNNKLVDVRNWNSYFDSGHKLPLFSEISIDKYNNIWFRRRGESYGYYNPGKDSVQYFYSLERTYDITCFSEQNTDTIWLATSKAGLGFIDPNNPTAGVQIAFSYEILNTKTLRSIVIDEKNKMWALTEDGLININRNSGETILFDESYGVQVRDVWSGKNALIPGKLKLLSDGTMVIGYRRGLGFFNPDSLSVNKQAPEPYIINMMASDKKVPIHQDNDIKLNHDENFISFHYSALDIYAEGISFRHKLSGTDNQWIENVSDSEVAYSNLLPGTYTFTIETFANNNPDNKKALAISFLIRLPWWLNYWAIAAYILGISALLYFIYRFQLKRQLSLRETQRLRELDELKTRLYANITHEFRTPITVINGMADELMDSLNKNEKEKFRKKLETIERNGSNLLHLVNQMLDLAKLQHGKLMYNPTQANIIPWLQYIVESHRSLAEVKNVQLTFYSEAKELLMDYDTDQLSKVITNLLSNAIKFTAKKGKVIFHVKYESAENNLIFKIKDDGIGIPESEQANIFNRFYQVQSTKSNFRSGTGIGLSICKEIIEMINGTISVKSQSGEGSEFVVIIPVTNKALKSEYASGNYEKPFISKEIPEVDEDLEIEKAEPANDKPLVLIAEDNQDVAGYIRDTIRTSYRVKWVSDGEKAFNQAVEIIPDIVITDVMMPVKDGFELCNSLKQDIRTDHIPVIMLTARVQDADRISGFEHGADAYLTKPFNKKELLVRLEQLLKQRRLLQNKFSNLEIKEDSKKALSVEEQFIRKAILIVEKNIETSMFSAQELAQEVNLSESQLYRKLKAISGKSTAIFIRGVRLKKAHELLQSSSLSVSEIAYQVGFNDPAWFSRVFKEEYGISPSEAR